MLWFQIWSNHWDLHWQRCSCEISESQNGTWRAKRASREVSASILQWCFQDRKQGGRFWRHFKWAAKAIRQQEIIFEIEKTWNLSKLKNGQNWKILQIWTENLYIPPILGWQNPSNQRLWHTVRVTSKLSMDPTNVIASYPQVWLLALIWCKIGIFRYFLLFFVKILKLLNLWYFRWPLKVKCCTFEAFRAM